MFEDFFQDIINRFEDVEQRLSDPSVVTDPDVYLPLVQKHRELKEAVSLYNDYKHALDESKELDSLDGDSDMLDLIQEERVNLEKKQSILEGKLRSFLVPPDPNDGRNVIVEVRSGTGGEEAALFAQVLYRMYVRYAEQKSWTVDLISQSMTALGGLKEVIFSISGIGVYKHLKYESGTHRVQRIPETESGGRVHTSAATVAILPEVEDVDIVIDQKDLRIDTYRASGAGGQHVNKTDSAVRITHIPSGVIVACQDERSQFQNKEKAMRLLRARLYEKAEQEQQKKQALDRKFQVGSGDRSQKIRTYNYPQNRVTDHRIGLTLYSLDAIVEGEVTQLLESLIMADNLEKLNKMEHGSTKS